MEPYVISIHTSDRIAFKSCRRQWDILSDNRQGRKPIETPRPLDFGQAFHAGMATFYSPTTWSRTLSEDRPIMVAAAIASFKQVMIANKARYLELTGKEALEDEQQEEFVEDMELGPGMFLHYFDYVQRHNLDRFTPIQTELGFTIDIFTDKEIALFFPHLFQEGCRIVYEGRIDCLVLNEWGEYWIVDWKTGSMRALMSDIAFLELDEQLISYNWAVGTILGIPIAGNIYAQILKAYPLPLPALANTRLGRNFSTNKQNPTSYDIVVKQLTEAGESLDLYADYLNYLKLEGMDYVRRTPMHRNRHELDMIGQNIKMEVLDQLDPNLRIYPSPSEFKCKYCSVRPVCIGMNDGSDVEFILNEYTTKEMRTNG